MYIYLDMVSKSSYERQTSADGHDLALRPKRLRLPSERRPLAVSLRRRSSGQLTTASQPRRITPSSAVQLLRERRTPASRGGRLRPYSPVPHRRRWTPHRTSGDPGHANGELQPSRPERRHRRREYHRRDRDSDEHPDAFRILSHPGTIASRSVHIRMWSRARPLHRRVQVRLSRHLHRGILGISRESDGGKTVDVIRDAHDVT